MSSSQSSETLLLSQDDILELITPKDIVEIVDKTFQDMGNGKTINPTKVTLDLGETAAYPPYKGFMNAMPAYVGWVDSAGIKWVGGNLGERRRLNLPYITGMILLIDPKVGNFVAAMDGAYITNMRTGAQTAVALKYLHEGPSIRLGLYGAGMQGHTQTEAIAQLFEIEELCVYDIDKSTAQKFADDMRGMVKGKIVIAEDPEEAARGDAVICVTQSKEKFVQNDWIKPGTVLFPMGSHQECTDELVLKADKIIVDHVEQCLHRGVLAELAKAGKVTAADFYATIGEIAAGRKPGRISEKDRTICIPIGTGALDVAIGTIAMQRAQEKGIGGKFAFV